jgi:hypothetical protein
MHFKLTVKKVPHLSIVLLSGGYYTSQFVLSHTTNDLQLLGIIANLLVVI